MMTCVNGFFGFTFSGIYKEVQKKYGKTVDEYIWAARITQGFEIVGLWQELQVSGGQRNSGGFKNSFGC
jgi:hypothetical protein